MSEVKKKWNITKEVLEKSLENTPYEKYLNPQPINDNSINNLMAEMLIHAQNSPRKTNSIKFKQYENEYKKVLHNFIPKEICKMSEEEIYTKFKKNIPAYKVSSDKTYNDFATTVKETAQFLSKFDSIDDFKNFCESIINKTDKKYLPMIIQSIHGFGYALSLDFLKELGFECYAKPDTHIKDFISNIFKCENKEKSVIEKIDEITVATGETQYAIDKLIYLACTHNFYLPGDEKFNKSNTDKNNKRRKALIEEVQKHLK